jgi:hypothetical protein
MTWRLDIGVCSLPYQRLFFVQHVMGGQRTPLCGMEQQHATVKSHEGAQREMEKLESQVLWFRLVHTNLLVK